MGLFDKLRGRAEMTPDGVVYAFTFKVASGETQIPPPMVGAYVTAYSTAATPTAAAERAWQELRRMGYVVEDMKPTGHEVPLGKWDDHVAHTWPEFVDHFPRQNELLAALDRDNAVFAPFAGFE